MPVLSPWITTVVIPVIVSFLTAWATHAFAVRRDRVGLRDKHTWEQRAELRRVVGSYHGRVLEAAVDWDRRMQQLYRGSHAFMCGRADAADRGQYFFHSMVFRFLTLLSLARRFERRAFFIDASIAREGELEFLRYMKSFIWVMTYSDITPDDGIPARDHFLNDEFRSVLDLCGAGSTGEPVPVEGPPFTYRDYWRLVELSASEEDGGPLDDDARLVGKLLDFFAELGPDEVHDVAEPRRRWQRLVCLHLLVLGFIWSFGYPWQRHAAKASVEIAIASLQQDGVSAAAFLDEGGTTLGLRGRPMLRPVTRHSYDRIVDRLAHELAAPIARVRAGARDDGSAGSGGSGAGVLPSPRPSREPSAGASPVP